MRTPRLRYAGALLALSLSSLFGHVASAAADGDLIKASGPAVYYVAEGKRWVFPNEKTYFSWYQDFSGVKAVSDAELASFLIGGNVTVKPGTRLVKLQSDPKVYAVGAGGHLRWIASEDAARALFGDDWNHQVDDISDAFWFSYKEGTPIQQAQDFNREAERSVGSIAADVGDREHAPAPSPTPSPSPYPTPTPVPPASGDAVTAIKYGAWSDNAVWGGRAPVEGSRVVIPANMKVIYDLASSPKLESVDVQGTLDFYPAMDTKLSVRKLIVHGTLSVGSADKPLPPTSHAKIELTGTSAPDDGLLVDGGTLSLHGAKTGPSWTTLAAPAAAGDTTLTFSAPVTWPEGDGILVMGDRQADKHETRPIAAIDGSTLSFLTPLEGAHRSEEGARAEVVHGTRNVVVSGAGAGQGSGIRALNRANVDVQDAAIIGAGRKANADMPAILLDGLVGGTLKNDLILESGNRCLVLKQTSGVQVEGVAAVRVYGSCFVTDDGSETGNTFKGNLAALVMPGALPEDATPAGFRLRNADNVLQGNDVVASTGYGYWYDLPEDAIRNDGTKLKPRLSPLGTFSDDSVRGVSKTGLFVDDGDKGRMNFAPDEKGVFSGLTATLNGERGFWIRGSNVEVSHAFIAENPIGGTFAAFGAALKDSTFAGTLEGSTGESPARYGFTYQDGPVSVQGVTFERFAGASAALGFEEHDPTIPDPRNSLRGATFTDARHWKVPDPQTAGDKMSVIRDLDAHEAVGAKSDFLGPNCRLETDANAYRCTDTYAPLLVALRGGTGDRAVTFTNVVTGASVELPPGPAFDGQYAYANVAEGGSYRVETPTVEALRVEYDGVDEPLTLRVRAPAGAQVTADGQSLEKKALKDLTPGSWAYEQGDVVLMLAPGGALNLDF